MRINIYSNIAFNSISTNFDIEKPIFLLQIHFFKFYKVFKIVSLSLNSIK